MCNSFSRDNTLAKRDHNETAAQLAECHAKQKAGYDQHTKPTMNIISATQNKTSPAIEYWINELATKGEATKDIYQKYFAKFAEFAGKTPDELLRQRQENQTNTDPKIQRLIESQLLKFISTKRDEGLAPATLQIYYASVRSFFEIHYYPLKIRRGDYPTGNSIGVRRATKEAIIKALENKATRHKAITNAVTLFLKDSGLRVSDASLLNYGSISKQLESGAKIIPITIITQKVKLTAKTFIGEEARQALKTYLEARQHGTRRLPPEKQSLRSVNIFSEIKHIFDVLYLARGESLPLTPIDRIRSCALNMRLEPKTICRWSTQDREKYGREKDEHNKARFLGV